MIANDLPLGLVVPDGAEQESISNGDRSAAGSSSWQVADHPNQSPRGGNQFFGHVAIDAAGELTVSLRSSAGTTLWSRDLAPA